MKRVKTSLKIPLTPHDSIGYMGDYHFSEESAENIIAQLAKKYTILEQYRYKDWIRIVFEMDIDTDAE